jgi:trk system potassium uptake protein TrkH
MLPDLKVILRDTGTVLTIFGAIMLSVVGISYYFSEFDNGIVYSMLIPSLVVIDVGLAMLLIFRKSGETELKHGLVIAAASWLILPAISTIPFIMTYRMGPTDAFFETMSGWTGTGLTMISDPSQLTHTLQFWRSLMQWVGGVGVIVLMVTILTGPGTGSFTLYRSEGRTEKILPSVVSTVRTIWWIYLLFTLVGIGLFYIAGMGIWGSVNHSMTTIATAGFAITKNSIQSYNSIPIEIAIIPIMLLGATPFLVHYKALRGNLRAIFKDAQVKALIAIVALGILILTLENYYTYYRIAGDSIFTSLRFSSFQFISALTTTGHQTANIHAWTETAKIILSIAMVIGGAAGSTAGGIKLVRGILIYRGTRWSFKKASLPKHAVASFKLGEKQISEEETNRILAEANLITILWLIFLFLGTIVLLHVVDTSQYRLGDVFFEVASAQGNAGLSTGITSLSMNPIGKIMLTLNMWIGRLEIFPVLMLFRSLIRGLKPF